MKWILRIAGLGMAVLIFLAGSLQLASEAGEVVVLTTTDDSGAPVETRLWVVELEGYQYLRSSGPASGWYKRLLANPDVEVVRNGQEAAYRTIPAPGQADVINGLMARKYGFLETYIGTLLGREKSIPIRLDPLGP